MKKVESKSTQKLGVKAYSNLIGKSDKTVYKMIKDGLIAAKKGKNGYEVIVDSYILEGYNDMHKELNELKSLLNDLDKRLQKLESKSVNKKAPLKKVNKPVKKAVAKAPQVKKPLKKVLKKKVKKSTKK